MAEADASTQSKRKREAGAKARKPQWRWLGTPTAGADGRRHYAGISYAGHVFAPGDWVLVNNGGEEVRPRAAILSLDPPLPALPHWPQRTRAPRRRPRSSGWRSCLSCMRTATVTAGRRATGRTTRGRRSTVSPERAALCIGAWCSECERVSE
jgi:hypothetical protein